MLNNVPEQHYDGKDKQDQDNYHVAKMDTSRYMLKLMDYVDMYMMNPINRLFDEFEVKNKVPITYFCTG